MNHIHISESCEITPHEILPDMFTKFLEISSRFIQADKAKGVKTLTFSPQYIEQQISTFYETNSQMKEQKTIIYSLRKVEHSSKSSLNTMFCPFWAYLEHVPI